VLGCFGGSCGDGVGGRHDVGRERWLDGVVPGGRFEALKHCAAFKKELFQVGCVRSYIKKTSASASALAC
jgi:hypothetical protein